VGFLVGRKVEPMKTAFVYSLFKKSSGISTDTRKIKKGSLFFALKGARFNGNAFALEALKKGASYAVVDEEINADEDERIILVKNTLETLQKLAKHHRTKLDIPILALTGSNGKTTSKELIHAVLSKKFKTLATEGNLNNHIGVPLTLLSFTEGTEIGVVEMGANHQKEIESLCKIAVPDYGYITNFGKAHLEGFGGFSGVVKGKTELYRFLKKNQGQAFVNLDDPIQMEKSKGLKRHLFGKAVTALKTTPFVKVSFEKNILQTQLIGTHNLENIKAAIAVGTHFKVAPKDIIAAIESYVPKNNRSQITSRRDASILLDAYNANPSSMRVALENFNRLEADLKILILGDMFELGKASEFEHQEIVKLAENQCFDEIHLIGSHFSKTNVHQAIQHQSFEDFYQSFRPKKNAYYLIKGSRAMALERILDLFD
jgi:UDP-N-acetylmuramoyl-tripeptide--D-alanyl-D-alanine ligase